MCLTGLASEQEMDPDKDLGKCVKTGCRNVVRHEGDRD
jgi:hypothetical protein